MLGVVPWAPSQANAHGGGDRQVSRRSPGPTYNPPMTYLTDPALSSGRPRLAIGASISTLLDSSRQLVASDIGKLRDQGYESVEIGLMPGFTNPHLPAIREAGLKVIGQGMAPDFDEAKRVINAAKSHGVWAVNLQLGHAFLSIKHAAQLWRMCDQYARERQVLIMLQTCRGTMTQDLLRTEELAEREPKIRFCLDLSQYVLAYERDGGDQSAFERCLGPIATRSLMIHGRISDGYCLQAPVQSEDADVMCPFIHAWELTMSHLRRHGPANGVLVFCPVLGPNLDRDGKELTDRPAEVRLLVQIARHCWDRSSVVHVQA